MAPRGRGIAALHGRLELQRRWPAERAADAANRPEARGRDRESLKVIGIPERVFTHEELAAYVMAESDDAEELAREETPVQDLVCADEAFRKTSEAIYTHLHAAFGDVEEYVQRFAPYKETFFENHAYTDNIREIYKDVDLKVYRAEIEKYRDQVTDFENDIPYSADIGVIHVDSEDLKMRLMPSPVQCLHALKSLLPELMDAGFKTLLDELQTVLPVVTGNRSRSRRS